MKAVKYPEIDKLPAKAKSIKLYAAETGFAPAYIYVKYERAKRNETTVNYKIVKYQGINFVIPD